MSDDEKQVIAMCAENYDWKTHWTSSDDDIRDVFRKCIKPLPDNLDGSAFSEFHSWRPDDSPATLYRLLWLVEPKEVKFGDMYKAHLFSFMSADERFIAAVELYKYEVGIYFYTNAENIETKNNGVWGGWPGADNHVRLKDGVDGDFVEMVKAIANTVLMVYGGNNFEV